MTRHRSPHDARDEPHHRFGARLCNRLGHPPGPRSEHTSTQHQTSRLKLLHEKDSIEKNGNRTTDSLSDDRRSAIFAKRLPGDDLRHAHLTPPMPPLQPTPLTACSPETPIETLWEFARHHPRLRMWIVANPAAPPELMEYISQQGGPGVAHALSILLDSIEGGNKMAGKG